MPIDIEALPALTLAGVEVTGRRSELAHRVPLAWKRLAALAAQHAARPGVFFGATPASDHGDAPDATYTYWCAFEIAGPVPADLAPLTLPARRYARATVRGDASAIDATYLALAEPFLAGELVADREGWFLERYEMERQSPVPPYEGFDYDVLRPLAE